MLIKTIRAALAACLLIAAGSPAEAQMNLATSTLTAVKKRDQLVCGVNGELPGFSQQNAQKQWLGFDVEFCRAIAAAAIGDSTKVRFVPLSAARRFEALRSGEIDVLVRVPPSRWSAAPAATYDTPPSPTSTASAIVVPKRTGHLARRPARRLDDLRAEGHDARAEPSTGSRRATSRSR